MPPFDPFTCRCPHGPFRPEVHAGAAALLDPPVLVVIGGKKVDRAGLNVA